MAKSRKKFLRIKGGSLVMIAGLLVTSGILRVGIEAGPALARSEANKPADADMHEGEDRNGALHIPDRDGMHEMLEAFRVREERLKERERVLEERAHAIDIADKAVTEKLEELVAAEAALRSTLELADGAVERDIARLTSVYETMKPKEAAALFEEMAPEFAAGFLARMRPEAAALIMTGLSPDVAYTISVVMAGRNAQAPIE